MTWDAESPQPCPPPSRDAADRILDLRAKLNLSLALNWALVAVLLARG